jgi:hypothetical protein
LNAPNAAFLHETAGGNREVEMRQAVEWPIDHVLIPVRGQPDYVCRGSVITITRKGAYSGSNLSLDARTILVVILVTGTLRPPLPTQFVIGNLPLGTSSDFKGEVSDAWLEDGLYFDRAFAQQICDMLQKQNPLRQFQVLERTSGAPTIRS